ncbi:hypothetical protein BDV95DRAFT_269433 [Massariosphaeria phaeospora]|uniref:Zn(2)-C6 fungal-type domain-containing protein n=1 Tax=Massariosphaeria phaeospora TaxID=100035 RepID=A0A7C8M195_9PLEO|nr:hypothetical protein BDV95DRAFT_269433 [Massariosphaeria phaeospora]
MPRRFHRKSRFGCTECRKRRVKCDEDEPVCGRCVRTRSECHYPSMESNPESNPESPFSTSNASGTPSSSAARDSSAPQSSFDLLDMTLMHHYVTDTCKHLFKGARQIHVWQHDIPALAASNVILVHGFLAVTAIHCAWKEPAHRDLYRSRALYHHGLSLPIFQEMVAFASSETAEVIVAYSILLCVWVYSFPGIAPEHLSLDDILSTVDVIRGSRTVFRLYRGVIMESPMHVFLNPPLPAPIPENQNYPVRQTLQSLRDQVGHRSDKNAARQLQTFLDRYITGFDYNRLSAAWMASVEDDYWTRLRDRHPDAVLVLAYSALLIPASEHECWWMSGWSRRILQACSDILSQEVNKEIDWVYHERRIRAGADELADIVRSRQG